MPARVLLIALVASFLWIPLRGRPRVLAALLAAAASATCAWLWLESPPAALGAVLAGGLLGWLGPGGDRLRRRGTTAPAAWSGGLDDESRFGAGFSGTGGFPGGGASGSW